MRQSSVRGCRFSFVFVYFIIKCLKSSPVPASFFPYLLTSLQWRYRELTSLATTYNHGISSCSHGFICLGHDKTKWTEKKNQCFNSACLYCLSHHTEYEFILCTALQISHNNVSYSLDVALAYISYKAHHCSSQFGDTDAIPYIVITEESNINVCFILYTSTIRT